MNFSDKILELVKNKSVSKAIDKLKKDKKTLAIILVGLVGMLIILLVPSDSKKQKVKENTVAYSYDTENILSEVELLIESIKGAGEAKVFITYESDMENVYAVNVDEKSDGSDAHYKSEYIITDDESGLILKVMYPKVRGVAVICKGGGDPIIKEKIYSVISALFDISTNKISVTDMK